MTLTDLLKKNPVVLSKYVSLGLALVDKTVAPLNKLMHHLLEIQGIDPNTQPGQKAREALVAAISGVEDSQEYEKDFDFSRFHNKYKKVAIDLKGLNLSKEQYKKITDLSLWDDRLVAPAPALQRTRSRADVVPEVKPDLKKPEFLDPIEDLKAFTEKYNVTSPITMSGKLDTISLHSALKKLEEYAKVDAGDKQARAKELCQTMVNKKLLDPSEKAIKTQMEEIMGWTDDAFDSMARVVDKYIVEKPTERFDANRQPTVVGGTRRTKGRSKVVRPFKNGLFRRVEVK